MVKSFHKEHSNAYSHQLRELLYASNPNKYYVIKRLLEVHKGKKVLVFADKLFSLKYFATNLKKLFICGEVSNIERKLILDVFKTSPDVNVLFFSKVGDNAIDLPDAQVIIQISSHGRARRQEAQRLGRILRPKHELGYRKGQYSAFFYTLISEGTRESEMAIARQRFLMDQGYTYELLPFKDLKGMQPESKEWELQLLESILNLSDSDLRNQEDMDREVNSGRTGFTQLRGKETQFYAEVNNK
jgi:DNA excision repair protein ERCC-3